MKQLPKETPPIYCESCGRELIEIQAGPRITYNVLTGKREETPNYTLYRKCPETGIIQWYTGSIGWFRL